MNLKHLLTVLLVLTLCACSGATRTRELNSTLAAYANVIRWMDIETAFTYMDPETREQQVPSELELSRWQQFRVTGYREGPVQMLSESEARQNVEISMTNRHNMAERVIRDSQVWVYNEKDKRWFLTSGLPDISTRR